MYLVENEIMQKLQAAIGSGFSAYYIGEVKVPPKSYLPCLMVFGEGTSITGEDTLKDRLEYTITIRAVVDLMASVNEKGTLNAHNLIISSTSGTFVAGETITGQTSAVQTTISTGGTAFLVVGQYGSTQTFAVGEIVSGGTSGATATVTSVLNNSIIQSQYQLRQLMEGRDPATGQYLSNSVLGVLRSRANLRGTYYYFSKNLKISYKAIQAGEFFYVGAEMKIVATTDLIQRPGY